MAFDIPVASVNFSPSAKLIGQEFKSYIKSYTKSNASRIAGHVFFHDSIKDSHSLAGVEHFIPPSKSQNRLRSEHFQHWPSVR